MPKIWRPVTYSTSTETFGVRLEYEENSTTDCVDLDKRFNTLEEALAEIEQLKAAKVNHKPAKHQKDG